MIKVVVNDVIANTCTKCGNIDNIVEKENVYNDEYVTSNFRLLNELGLKNLIPTTESKVFEANLIIDQINNALKELNVNRDAYSDLQKFIHPTTVFLWGLRITLEEYPNSIVKFIKPF
jgi:hypothetical protein